MVNDILARKEPDVAGVSPRVASQWVGAVNQAAEQMVRLKRRIFQVALQFRQHPPLAPFEGFGREDGVANHVREELKCQGQVLGPDAQRGAGRAHLHGAAHVLDCRGQLEGRTVHRPFFEQSAGEGGHARSSLAEPAGIDVELQRDDPGAFSALVEDAQPISQAGATRPEIEGPRTAAGDDDRGDLVRRGCRPGQLGPGRSGRLAIRPAGETGGRRQRGGPRLGLGPRAGDPAASRGE